MRGSARRLALAMTLALTALALTAAAAQAVIVTASGERISLELLARPSSRGGGSSGSGSGAKPSAQKPVVYHTGGVVMPSNTNYAIFWDPSGGAAFPPGFQAGIDRWFEDLAHDSGGVQNTDSVLTQYSDEFGDSAAYDSHFAGALIDTDPYPANGCAAAPICLDSAQIRGEITSFVEGHSLPTDLEHMYFLLTPSEVESCTDAAEKVCSAGTGPHADYCAYHNFIELPKGVIIYAYNPYVAGLGCGDEANRPNGNPSDEELAGGLAHEHSEAVTDPELNAWYDSKKDEVGDKCRVANDPEVEFGAPLGTAPDGSKYNQLIDGDEYWYQQEWSNEAGECAQRKAAVPTIKKIAPKNGLETGGTAVRITGTGFTSTATVDFGGVPAEKVTFESSTSITAVSPAHEAGSAFVTVTTEGGTSEAESKKARFKYKKVKTPKGR